MNGTAVEPGGGLGTVALVRTDGDVHLGCSAVLIAPTVVLTAAHCLIDEPEVPEGVDCWSGCDEVPEAQCQGSPKSSAESLFVAAGFTGQDDLANAEFVPVREVSTHPRYNAFNLCNDIAVLGLEVPVTAVDPVPTLPADMLSGIELGSLALAQGYGRQLDPGSSELLPQERYVQLLNETLTEIVHIDESFLETVGVDSSSACYGDSGGPLYVEKGGVNYVIGIHNSTRPSCGGHSTLRLVPAYEEWIEATKLAEHSGSDEGGGGGCSAVPGGKPLSPLALFSLLLLLVGRRRLRGARRGLVVLCLVSMIFVVGCADEALPDVRDPSFCTDAPDPLGEPSVERMDLIAADALVRKTYDFGDEVWLWSVEVGLPEDACIRFGRDSFIGGSSLILDADGLAGYWRLGYRVAKDHPVYGSWEDGIYYAAVSAAEGVDGDGESALDPRCIPEGPILPLDTREVVADAVERFESSVGPLVLDEEVHLTLSQRHPCEGSRSPLRNEVSIHTADGTFSAFYDEEGTFIFTMGP